MKKNDFSQPTKQSVVSILLILYRYYRIIVRQLWPILAYTIYRNGSETGYLSMLLFIGFLVAIFSLGMAILSFYKHMFFINNNELHVTKGVFKRKSISIPFEKIQTINFQEKLVHRFLGTTGVEIDTAGSAKKEFDLDAIDLNIAISLRSHILEYKSAIKQDQIYIESGQIIEDTSKSIINHDILDLIKIGVSNNHFRSAAILIGFYFTIQFQLEDFNIYIGDYFPEIEGYQILKYLSFIILFAIFFMIIAFLLSLIRTVLTYYKLKLTRIGNGFKLSSGLFTRREYAAFDQKLQMINWGNNLLQKSLFNITNINLKQASSILVKTKKAINIPGVRTTEVNDIINFIYPQYSDKNIVFEPVSIHKFYSMLLYLSLGMLTLITIQIWAKSYLLIAFYLLFYFWMIFINHKNYKKLKFGYDANFIQKKGGTFGNQNSLSATHKIQAISLKKSPYQKRRNLSSVVIHTASGNIVIPYLIDKKAFLLANFFSEKVVRSKKKWM